MRRRGETTSSQAAAAQPAAQSTQQGVDWVTKDAPGDVRMAQQINAGRAAGQKIALTVAPADGPAADPRMVTAGDLLTVTMGKEVFYPQKFNGFEVGPLSVQVAVRDGESAARAWARARTVLEQLYEAELQLRLQEYQEHLFRAREGEKG